MVRNGFQLCIDLVRPNEENQPLLETVCFPIEEKVEELYRSLRVAYEYDDLCLDFICVHWVDDKIEETWVY